MQGLGAGPISLFGSPELKAAYLPRVAKGDAIAAFAISESDAGSDVVAMRTTARREGDEYVIDGEKTWISNGGIADSVRRLLPARQRRTGFHRARRGAGRSRILGERAHHHHRAASAGHHSLRRLPRAGDRSSASRARGFASRSARSTSSARRSAPRRSAFARRALDESLAHVTTRQMFGQLLQDFQLTQAKIADMATSIDASALLVYRAAWTRDQGAERITREAAMAKLFATEAAQRVIDDAVQLLGGRGVVADHPVERLYREIRALRIYEGTSEVQQLVIAGQVLRLSRVRARQENDAMAEHAEPSGHVDTFCARPSAAARAVAGDALWDAIPELAYPARLNCSVELLDTMIEAGNGDRPAIRFPGGEWSYRELLENANRIAHVLVDDLGIVPGNRVLLRGANTPMLAACWFGVLKAGGVVVCTMALLRERELQYIAQKAEISLALTDARVAEDCEAAMRVPVMRVGGDGRGPADR